MDWDPGWFGPDYLLRYLSPATRPARRPLPSLISSPTAATTLATRNPESPRCCWPTSSLSLSLSLVAVVVVVMVVVIVIVVVIVVVLCWLNGHSGQIDTQVGVRRSNLEKTAKTFRCMLSPSQGCATNSASTRGKPPKPPKPGTRLC